MGLWMRKPKAGKSKEKSHALHFAPTEEIFSTFDFKKRTDDFYIKFAKDTLENDIIKEAK